MHSADVSSPSRADEQTNRLLIFGADVTHREQQAILYNAFKY
jgi:hypothetical protein